MISEGEPKQEQEISAKLRGFLESEFPNEGTELDPTTDLLDEWFVDSLGIVQTVMFLEESFGIEIARADINGENFKNISALSAFVARRLAS